MFETFVFQAKSFSEFEFIQQIKIIYFLTMRYVNKIR